MSLIEVQVHQVLVAMARQRSRPLWPHHLTLARLVARGLRLGRSALIQTHTGVGDYAISYLTPALIGDQPLVIVVPSDIRRWLLGTEIPRLQELLDSQQIIHEANVFPYQPEGIHLLTPAVWLAAMFEEREYQPVTTVLNPVDELWQWTQDFFTCTLTPRDWEDLKQQNSSRRDFIQAQHLDLAVNLFRRSPNPYQCFVLEPEDGHLLERCLDLPTLPQAWQAFAQTWRNSSSYPLCWASLKRGAGTFELKVAPQNLAPILEPLWQRQTTLFIGGFLDADKVAPTFRPQIGLESSDLTCINFSPSRQQSQIQIYLPEKRLTLPNTPEFQDELLTQLQRFVRLSRNLPQPTVLIINDVPLQAQVASVLAAEFGSLVKVERDELQSDSILICGWNFWQSLTEPLLHGQSLAFALPKFMAIATLPIPSRENPLVAGRISYYKQKRQDWFRLYLLPTALRQLQRAIFPLHQEQGIVAIFDNRINHRAYGKQILEALQPCSICHYLDPSWFGCW